MDLAPAPWGETQPLRELARVIADPQIDAELRRCELDREYPASTVAALRAAGVPAVWGEPATGPRLLELCTLNAVSAASNASLAITLGVTSLALLPVLAGGDRDQQATMISRARDGALAALLLTEREHGSDLLANEMRADAVSPAGYRLHGEKHLINGGAEHPIFVVLARTRAPTTRLRAVDDFSLFWLERDTPGVEAYERVATLSAPAADISCVRFRDVAVPASQRIGREGAGFSIMQRALAISRGGVSCLAAGTSSAAVALASRHLLARTLYDQSSLALEPVAEHVLHCAAGDVLATALAIKQAVACNAWGPGAGYYTAIAKVGVCDLAERAVRDGAAALGAHALTMDRPFHALLRDVWLFGVFDGTRHVMLDSIQRRLAPMLASELTSDESLALWKAAYARMPGFVAEIVKLPSRIVLVPWVAHAEALARLAPASSLVAIARVLSRACNDAIASSDATVRFELARCAAGLEAAFALIELVDPSVRSALTGAAPLATEALPAQVYQLALAHATLELALALQRIAPHLAADCATVAGAAARVRAAERARLHPILAATLRATYRYPA